MDNMQLNFSAEKFEIKKHRTSERAELVGEITDLLNSERIGTKWKTLTYKRVGILLGESKATIQDIYWLLKRMKEAESAGKVFFGSMKKK